MFENMEQGVHWTGPEDPSPLYITKYPPATLTVEQLDHQAIWKRKALMGKAMTEEEIEQSADLKRESMEEVAVGFLEGPSTEAQLTQRLGSDQWSLTKRFCLYQGEEKKIRVLELLTITEILGLTLLTPLLHTCRCRTQTL